MACREPVSYMTSLSFCQLDVTQVWEAYLPAQLSPDELQAIIAGVIAETGASGPKAMGNVMKAVGAKVAGRADSKAVSDAVKAALAA